ncbi:MAG TPA: type 1 glutamine amidotransferase [bacterium]|nr:type 1 glutamine amidotransferase [bacterium]
MRIHYFQHVPYEGLGSIASWLRSRSYSVNATRFYENDVFPPLSELDALIVMGGPMGVNDEAEYPWLASEKRYIEDAIQAGKVVIGICLGAQLLAQVLGARVFQNPDPEIGWFPVRFSERIRSQNFFPFLPQEFTVFHWHGDTFDLPPDTVPLGASEGCPNQGFYDGGHVLGLQFHLESTPEGVRDLVANSRKAFVPGKYIQSPEHILSVEGEFREINRHMVHILETMLGTARHKNPESAKYR